MTAVSYSGYGYFANKPAISTTSNGKYRPATQDFVQQFNEDLLTWRDATSFFSDPVKITSHPCFRRMVYRADVYAPLIVDELRKQPSLLVWALDAAYGVQPYSAADAGDIASMSRAWVAEWGKVNAGRF